MTNPKVPADVQPLFKEFERMIEREFTNSKVDFQPSGHGGKGIWHAVVLCDFKSAYDVLHHPRVQGLKQRISQETSVVLSVIVKRR